LAERHCERSGEALKKLSGDGLKLTMMSNRGVKVWPGGHAETFVQIIGAAVSCPLPIVPALHIKQIISLLRRVSESGFDFIKTENLYKL